MRRNNVVITQRVDAIASRSEYRDGLDVRLSEWLIEAGLSPFPIPNCLAGTDYFYHWINHVNPCCIILSGGGDVFHVDQRSDLENQLLNYAERKNVAVLGICRGMQVLAKRAGVGLVRIEGHVNSLHSLISCNQSDLLIPARVNSYHNFCIESVPVGYRAIALSSDNCIEGIKHSSLPWEGWMWHPERNAQFANIDTVRLRNLIEEAS